MASYYVWSGATGSANGTTWANAYTTLTLAFAGKAAGDVFYVAHDHAETTGASITLTATNSTVANPSKIICVNRAGSVPPVSADRRATATVTTTGAFNITITGFAHYDGIIFSSGTGATSSSSIILATVVNHWLRFDNCSLRLGIAFVGSRIYVGGSAGSLTGTYVEFNNTTVSFADVGHIFSVVGVLKWRNTPSALLGTVLGTLFTPMVGGQVECLGVDFSAAGSGKTLIGANSGSQGFSFRFVDCKLNAAVTKSLVPVGHGTVDVDFIRSGATGNYAVFRQRISATLDQETTIVRTGGATDGTTPISWKVTTTLNSTYSMPFECPPIAIWCDTTGSAKTATIECVGTAIATDQEVWLDLEYLGDASSPQGSFVNDGKVDLLATAVNQTTSTATWGGALTGKFNLAVTFTPQQKGWVYARVKCAKASSTFYIDPLVTLT